MKNIATLRAIMPTDPNQQPPIAFETDDAEAAFKHFGPLVASIPEDALDPWNADPEIVRINARRALEAVRPHLA